MSDGQSFPFQSEVHPDLTKGAYSPESIYTISQVSEIITYANSFGIRVMVEFDMPSHAGPAWGKGYPFLTMNCSNHIIECRDLENYYTDPCSDFPFDATNDKVYDFLNSFINEISGVFLDNYLHMGGDEVKEICWATPEVLKWMHQHNMTEFSQLEQYFLSRVQDMAKIQGKVFMSKV